MAKLAGFDMAPLAWMHFLLIAKSLGRVQESALPLADSLQSIIDCERSLPVRESSVRPSRRTLTQLQLSLTVAKLFSSGQGYY